MGLPGLIFYAMELLLPLIGCQKRVSVLSAHLASNGVQKPQDTWDKGYGRTSDGYKITLNEFHPNCRHLRSSASLKRAEARRPSINASRASQVTDQSFLESRKINENTQDGC